MGGMGDLKEMGGGMNLLGLGLIANKVAAGAVDVARRRDLIAGAAEFSSPMVGILRTGKAPPTIYWPG